MSEYVCVYVGKKGHVTLAGIGFVVVVLFVSSSLYATCPPDELNPCMKVILYL